MSERVRLGRGQRRGRAAETRDATRRDETRRDETRRGDSRRMKGRKAGAQRKRARRPGGGGSHQWTETNDACDSFSLLHLARYVQTRALLRARCIIIYFCSHVCYRMSFFLTLSSGRRKAAPPAAGLSKEKSAWPKQHSEACKPRDTTPQDMTYRHQHGSNKLALFTLHSHKKLALRLVSTRPTHLRAASSSAETGWSYPKKAAHSPAGSLPSPR